VETWEDEAGTYVRMVLRGRKTAYDRLWVRWHLEAANERPRPAPVA
jgi:hypothetical protein